MSQTTQLGEAEIDAYIAVRRAATGAVEHFHVVGTQNIKITAAEYAAATQEG